METFLSYPLLYQANLVLLFALALGLLPLLRHITAPYGRHARGGWGPTVENRLGWVIMESPAVYIVAAFYFTGQHVGDPVVTVFFLLWQLHYVYRSFIYPALDKARNKRMPMVVMFSAVLWNILNGYNIGFYFHELAPVRTTHWFVQWPFFVGLILFLTGFYLNIQSDAILRALRKPGETGYKIPYGGLHDYVASPNYFAEIVEWFGFALLTYSWCGLAFACFTAGNLIPRALSHLAWYRETFPNYPAERKAVIPFLL